MSDAEEELVSFEELEGAHATLKRTLATPELAKHFAENEEIRAITGRLQEVTQEILTELMEDDETLFAWKVMQGADHIGYAFFVTYDGPPFIALYGFDGGLALDIGVECMEQLVPVFFKNTNEDALFYYLPHPVDPEFQEALVDNGFDPWDENPTIDNDEIACFVLERYTYDAYFGEGSDEFEEADEEEFY